MALKPNEWHDRFCQQARWTRALRLYLFERFHVDQANRILEVGCGTGALLSEFNVDQTRIHGLDLNQEYLELARQHAPIAQLTQGDALHLPYASGSFDSTLCHFLLLWVDDPVRAAAEMRRVTRSGGSVLAMAEPDYGGRIDYPPELGVLGVWQQQALQCQGADPLLGRRLAAILNQAGLKQVECGVLGGQWQTEPDPQAGEAEWRILLDDLGDHLNAAELEELHEIDRKSRLLGERILFVPTLYASGRV